jgi:hypothetical protein
LQVYRLNIYIKHMINARQGGPAEQSVDATRMRARNGSDLSKVRLVTLDHLDGRTVAARRAREPQAGEHHGNDSMACFMYSGGGRLTDRPHWPSSTPLCNSGSSHLDVLDDCPGTRRICAALDAKALIDKPLNH